MKDELLKKIERTLNEGISTEKDVVYFLVEVRKLMDRERYEDSVIRSFTNWIVHIELGQEREGTTDLLKEFDEVVRMRKEENKGSLCPPHCSFETFRRNLGGLLETSGLPSKLVEHEKSWMIFARLYSSVVSDCPIKLTASKKPLKYVKEVVLKKPDVFKEGPHIEFLEWQVTLTDGQVEPYPNDVNINKHHRVDGFLDPALFGRCGPLASTFLPHLRIFGAVWPEELDVTAVIAYKNAP